MARNSMTGEEASLLCIMAQGRHLIQDVRVRESLLDSLARSTMLVQRVGSLILGIDSGPRPTARHRSLAAAFISWADRLPSQIDEQAAYVERQAEKSLQRNRGSRKTSKPIPTLWERALKDEL